MDIKIDLDEKIKELINKTVSNISSIEKVQAGVKANATYKDGTSMHEVALKNEFGGTTTDENGKNHVLPYRLMGNRRTGMQQHEQKRSYCNQHK